MKRPTIITVEEEGHERNWGLLSRTNAWRAGCFWEERGPSVKVFREKDGSRKEVEVLKRIEGGEKKPVPMRTASTNKSSPKETMT